MVLVTGRRGIDLLCSSGSGIDDFATDSLDRNRQQHEIQCSVLSNQVLTGTAHVVRRSTINAQDVAYDI